jgi:hypothetical protein
METQKFQGLIAEINVARICNEVIGADNGAIAVEDGTLALTDDTLTADKFDTTSIKIMDITDRAKKLLSHLLHSLVLLFSQDETYT